MRRKLSLLLVLALVIGVLPVGQFAGALDFPGGGKTMTVNMINGMTEAGDNILLMKTYNASKNKDWAYIVASYPTSTPGNSYYGTLRLALAAGGDWCAFKFRFANAGKFTLKNQYIFSDVGHKAEVYFLDLSDVELGETDEESRAAISDVLTSDNLVGEMVYEANTTLPLKELTAGVLEIPEAGLEKEYLLVIKNTGTKDYVSLTNLIFDGETPGGDPDIETATLSYNPGRIPIDSFAFPSVSAEFAGGGMLDLTDATFTYVSKTPSIASVDESTGVVKGLTKGTAEIEVSVTLNNVTVTDTCEIEVVIFEELPFAGVDKTISYNMMGEMYTTTDSLTARMAYDDFKNPNWVYAGISPSTSSPGGYYYTTMRAGPIAVGGYIYFKLKVPNVGRYTLRNLYAFGAANAEYEFYLFPVSTGVEQGLANLPPVGAMTYPDTKMWTETAIIGETFISSPGEYYLVAKNVGSAATTMSTTRIELVGAGAESPECLRITASSTALLADQTAELSAEAVSVSGAAESVAADYVSKNPAVATVSPSGTVTAISPGFADIEASFEGVTATKRVFVSSDAPQRSGAAKIIDFTKRGAGWAPPSGDSQDMRNITYAYTHDNWEQSVISRYVPQTNSAILQWETLCTRLTMNGPRQWFATKINLPAAGKYDASVSLKVVTSGIKTNIYLIPAGLEIEENLTDDCLLGTVNTNGPAADETFVLREVYAPEPGEYNIVWEYAEGGDYLLIESFNLDGSSPLSSITASVSPSPVAVGGTAYIAAKGLLENDDVTDLSEATFSYDALTPEIATVADGVITAKNIGLARFKVSATLDGITKDAFASVAVIAPSENTTVAGSGSAGAENADAGGAITSTVNGVEGALSTAALGDAVILSAPVTSENRPFLYWKDENSGRIVSASNEFSFTLGTDTKLKAVYGATSADGRVLVEFIDKNGKVLKSNLLAKNTVIEAPANPFMVGSTFYRWSPDYVPGAPAENNVIYVAEYNGDSDEYDITVDGGTGGGSHVYNYEATVTADADGNSFAYWAKNGQAISYDRTYSFRVWDKATLTAVTKDADYEIIKTPLVILEGYKLLDQGDGKYRAAFCMERTVPTGYTLIESGILIGESADITLESDGVKKAVSQKSAAVQTAQFTARVDNLQPAASSYARAYLIYKTGTEYKVIYSLAAGSIIE